jgi:hypothetical protein
MDAELGVLIPDFTGKAKYLTVRCRPDIPRAKICPLLRRGIGWEVELEIVP